MADDIAAAKKAPDAVDKHVGGRVRMRRLMLAMSQQKLAEALGVTFQQVQKYENGTNRVGAGRLQQISHILQVPVTFFFHDASKASATRAGRSALSMTQVDDFVTTSDGRRVIRAFLRADVRLRHRIAALVEKIVDDDANRTRDPGVRFGRPRKLTPHQRDEALRRLAAGETQADVARTYNVDPTTIGRYRCRIRRTR